MYAWQWWSWCFLLSIQVTQGKELPVHHVPIEKEHPGHLSESADLNEQHTRPRRDIDWPNEEGNGIDESYFTKRNPLLSRWGGQRLSDFLYYKRRPAFSSWGGKRGPAFSSWGGKRSTLPTNVDIIHHQTNNQTNPSYKYTNEKYPIYASYKFLPDKFFNEETFQNADQSNTFNHDILIPLNTSDHKIYFPNDYLQSIHWNTKNNKDKITETFHPDDYEEYDVDDGTDIKATIDLEKGTLILSNIFDKRAAPSFNSWGGKRAPSFNSWGGKRVPAFNSWDGKRYQAFNSWGGKRAPAFNSWGGKRAPAFNSWGGKRAPAFNSWGGKRNPSFNSWGGKRSPAFNSWGGKRSLQEFTDDSQGYTYDLSQEEMPSSNRKKRSLSSSEEDPKYLSNTWKDKEDQNYHVLDITEDKRTPSFNSWGGKRAPSFNSWGGKRVPAFNSWGGKRAPAFNSWGGKRAPAFNSWGGKRAPSFNSWGGKRVPAFNSWGGKRVPAFNSWGGKRVPAFNSWGGKRAPAFNSWGGKRTPIENTLYDWRNTYVPLTDTEKGSRSNDYSLDDKRTSLLSKGSGKRLPAFHSWGGKRSSIDYGGHFLMPDHHETIPHVEITNNDDMLSTMTPLQNPEELNPTESENFDSNANLDPQYSINYNKYTQSFNNNEDANANKNEKRKVVKRSIDEGKRNTAFYSWGGKRNMFQFNAQEPQADFYSLESEIPVFRYDKLTPNEGNGVNVREKRNIADNSIAFVTTDNGLSPGNGVRSSFEEIDSGMSDGLTVCCIKRAQYGNKNLFMQMLLRTKSFRDLSWPTVRPIRRGVDFYPWGGKRSSL